MENKTVVEDTEIIDIPGALKILGICRFTFDRWEKNGGVTHHKAIYRGRYRKCYFVSELKKLVR